jgi:hypothetical protein
VINKPVVLRHDAHRDGVLPLAGRYLVDHIEKRIHANVVAVWGGHRKGLAPEVRQGLQNIVHHSLDGFANRQAEPMSPTPEGIVLV